MVVVATTAGQTEDVAGASALPRAANEMIEFSGADVRGHLMIPGIVRTMRKPVRELGNLLLVEILDGRLDLLDGAHAVSVSGSRIRFNFRCHRMNLRTAS